MSYVNAVDPNSPAFTQIAVESMLSGVGAPFVAVALFFWVIGHYRLTRLLELMPYPVICGFMAGAIITGQVAPQTTVVKRSSQIPAAALPRKLAVPGAITKRSPHWARSIWRVPTN